MTEQSRQEFEKWFEMYWNGGGCSFARNADGDYIEPVLCEPRAAWQASRAAIVVTLPEPDTASLHVKYYLDSDVIPSY